MSPDERQLITGLFERLQGTANQPRDKDADALIHRFIQKEPYALYFLVQSVLVQNMALEAANKKIQELQGQARSSQAPQSGGFLSSIFGGSQTPASQARRAPPPPADYAPAAGGGFLRNALGTAAGVAGGVLLANSISSLFHDNPQGVAADMPVADQASANNDFNDQTDGNDNISDADTGDDSFFGDGGGDFGDDGGSFDV